MAVLAAVVLQGYDHHGNLPLVDTVATTAPLHRRLLAHLSSWLWWWPRLGALPSHRYHHQADDSGHTAGVWEWREVHFRGSRGHHREAEDNTDGDNHNGEPLSVSFAMRTGHGPPVLVLHGLPGTAEQGRLFAAELFPEVLVKKRLDPSPEEHRWPTPSPPLQEEESRKRPPYTFIAVSRPNWPLGLWANTNMSHNHTRDDHVAQESEADLYALLLDELDISKVALLSLPGSHSVAATFARRHREKCWAVVQVSPDAPSFNNCLTSTVSLVCEFSWLPHSARSFVAHAFAFILGRFTKYSHRDNALSCLAVSGNDRAAVRIVNSACNVSYHSSIGFGPVTAGSSIAAGSARGYDLSVH